MIGILACGISVIDNFWIICLGRLLHGFVAGVLCTAAPQMIGETVPAHLMDYGFGVSTNVIIMVGVMICMLLGIGIPDDD